MSSNVATEWPVTRKSRGGQRARHVAAAILSAVAMVAVLPAMAQATDPPLTGSFTQVSAQVAVGYGGIEIKWSDTIQNERGFLVYRVNGATTEFVNCPYTQPNITSCLDAYIPNNTIYRYYIYAWNDSGTTYAGTYLAGHSYSAPDTPSIRSATPTGTNSVQLVWVETASATEYRVYRYGPSGLQLVGTFPAGNYFGTVTNAAIDTSVINYFAVAAVTPAGEFYSDNYVYSMPYVVPTAATPIPPVDVKLLSGLDSTYINWTDATPDEDYYGVYRSDDTGWKFVCIETRITEVNFGCLDVDPIAKGKFARYYVYSVRGSTIRAAAPAVLSQPDRFVPPYIGGASGVSSSSILVTWASDPVAIGYRIYEYVGSAWVEVGVTVPMGFTTDGLYQTGSFLATGLDPSTIHIYSVVSERGGVQSGKSQLIYATTRAAAPQT
jgi:hypothetical protein